MKIAILFSNYMYSYIVPFLDLCEQNNIDVDFFRFEGDQIRFEIKAKNIYELHSKWKAKKYNTIEKIEEEIKSLVNVDDYEYFLSDTMGLTFKNACNYFHGNSTKYKIEHLYSGILQNILKLSHSSIIKKEAQIYQNTRFCFLGSSEMKRDYAKNFNIDETKIRIIHPGSDNRIKATNEQKCQNEIYTIGIVACGFNLKGGYNILKAIKKLKKDFTPDKIHFKIIHPSYNKQWYLKLYIKFLGIDKYIEFLPFQNNINDFYHSSDCIVCASNMESFGRVVTEAMTMGVPVIAGSNIGASDIIEDEVNGHIYEYGKNTVTNLANTIKKAYEQRNNNAELIKNAKLTAASINWKNFADRLFNILFNTAL